MFRIHDDILSRFPNIKIGVLSGRNVAVRRGDEGLEGLKGEVIQEVAAKLGSRPVAEHPYVSSWRRMYRGFGAKAGDYRPSAEGLLRRALRGRGLPTINTAVDAYNVVSLRHLIPMGGFDLDRVAGDIMLRFSAGGERFLPIGASEAEETYEGEAVYADDVRILTRRWNHRDCDETKITEETRNIVMFADGSPEIPEEAVGTAMEELASVLSSVCGGEIKTDMVDGNRRKLHI